MFDKKKTSRNNETIHLYYTSSGNIIKVDEEFIGDAGPCPRCGYKGNMIQDSFCRQCNYYID